MPREEGAARTGVSSEFPLFSGPWDSAAGPRLSPDLNPPPSPPSSGKLPSPPPPLPHRLPARPDPAGRPVPRSRCSAELLRALAVSARAWNMVGEMETKEKPKPSPDYLMQLMNDKKLMSSLPNFCGIFNHLERLLDEGKSARLLASSPAPPPCPASLPARASAPLPGSRSAPCPGRSWAAGKARGLFRSPRCSPHALGPQLESLKQRGSAGSPRPGCCRMVPGDSVSEWEGAEAALAAQVPAVPWCFLPPYFFFFPSPHRLLKPGEG